MGAAYTQVGRDDAAGSTGSRLTRRAAIRSSAIAAGVGVLAVIGWPHEGYAAASGQPATVHGKSRVFLLRCRKTRSVVGCMVCRPTPIRS